MKFFLKFGQVWSVVGLLFNFSNVLVKMRAFVMIIFPIMIGCLFVSVFTWTLSIA